MLYQITNYLIGVSLQNFFVNFHSPNIRFLTKFSDLLLLLSLLFFSFVSSQLCNTIFSLWSLRDWRWSSSFFFFLRSFSLLVFEFCFGLSRNETKGKKRQDFCFLKFKEITYKYIVEVNMWRI